MSCERPPIHHHSQGLPGEENPQAEALAAEAGAAGDFVLEQTLLQQAEWILREGRR
jgi:hypothetical protein